ncbi:MAG: cobalamin-independent methionine synthase II family protein [Parvularcula sp.]|jgi:5-methyltetrahydropteroyltriglutamate--homocysteine methyltransferase|nr:cobalamin-independent methionine synthase II family protein [Parvularcula sp.]
MTDRIQTTHVGSLPRSKAVSDVIFAKERGEAVEETQFRAILAEAVSAIVARQIDAGIDFVSDGEMSKISYATYIKDRVTGFDGDSPRDPPADLEQFPAFLERQAKGGGTPTYRRPMCVGDIAPKDSGPLDLDLAHLKSALEGRESAKGFMNAASPGVIALFQPNEHYSSQDEYLEAIAEAMRVEYEAIVDAGLVLQLDSPDLGLGRHTMFKHRSDEEYRNLAERHVEVLNHATRNIAPERMRMHICWGNYEGPHVCDAPLEQVLPIALKARSQALLFESANPRHAHEWQVVRDAEIPEDKVLVPGVIDSTTNYVEHPRLVAERILRFTDVVGRDRVIAGTDCGFSTFAGFGTVDPDIVFAKLAALSEGAQIASDELWGRAAG